jgi:hypothetical protein
VFAPAVFGGTSVDVNGNTQINWAGLNRNEEGAQLLRTHHNEAISYWW